MNYSSMKTLSCCSVVLLSLFCLPLSAAESQPSDAGAEQTSQKSLSMCFNDCLDLGTISEFLKKLTPKTSVAEPSLVSDNTVGDEHQPLVSSDLKECTEEVTSSIAQAVDVNQCSATDKCALADCVENKSCKLITRFKVGNYSCQKQVT